MIDPDARRRIEGMAEQANRFAATMSDLTGEGSDDAGLVRASCAAGGRLVDIELAAETRRMQTYELRAAILAATGRATDSAAAKLAEVVAQMTGGADVYGGDAVRQAREQVAQYQRLVDAQREKLEQLRADLGRS
ncbi:YbaB/EbfC family nucleoid-associated protein [Micromonospora sp. WMMD980]|uniref:YbaB/EbfC family nucleoid-associated protein n=1 Tax=Micromonospora sp. WMMD980 TaxID=3016088 RepID=UPI00241695F9|nr:YbaB/EbfC family nucleoid-associated protein [Micromonospora sp. WMMD980]MDG4803370.1 YbaB/EbfC family nucleoid-associated protein [Micromonospora sp. WMMD980]